MSLSLSNDASSPDLARIAPFATRFSRKIDPRAVEEASYVEEVIPSLSIPPWRDRRERERKIGADREKGRVKGRGRQR